MIRLTVCGWIFCKLRLIRCFSDSQTSTHIQSFLEQRLSHHVGQHPDQRRPLQATRKTRIKKKRKKKVHFMASWPAARLAHAPSCRRSSRRPGRCPSPAPLPARWGGRSLVRPAASPRAGRPSGSAASPADVSAVTKLLNRRIYFDIHSLPFLNFFFFFYPEFHPLLLSHQIFNRRVQTCPALTGSV